MRAAAISLLLFLLAAATVAAATLDEYVAALTSIHDALRGGRLEDARTAARPLLGARIEAPNGSFQSDGALLTSIIEAKGADIHLLERLEATLSELRRASPATKASRGDHALLNAIAREQKSARPVEGGQALPDDKLTGNAMVRFAEAIGRAAKWIAEKLEKFFEWLASFWPDTPEKEKRGDIRGPVIAIAVAIVILIGAVAFAALRRSRRARQAPLQSAAPAMSSHDADPLSRGANEWERYAAQLAAAGRTREAIRAWYHAVLVTFYSASILQFRKGRTNWEYVAMLAPSLPWRGHFIDLTRRFEVEWYGLHEGTEEALEECREMARRIMDAVRRVSRGAA